MGGFPIAIFLIAIVSVSSKPIEIKTNELTESSELHVTTITPITTDALITSTNEVTNATKNMRNVIRPGMVVNSYSIELEPDVDSGVFNGRTVIQVSITDQTTRDEPVMFYVSDDLNINTVTFALIGGNTFFEAGFSVDDGVLEIDPDFPATLYTFVIEYSGSLEMYGKGLYVGRYDDNTYLGMNLHPTYARRVFPCIDEPTEVSIISFTINNAGYSSIVSNSLLEDGSQTQFRALQGPAHLWGLVAHNFININIPTSNVLLYGRPGVSNQDAQASVAINFYFNNLNEWTNKNYFEILVNQDGRMNVMALPDVSRDWYSLSIVGVWEPYIFMETTHSVKQRKIALTTIAEAMAKQWFGYVIFPTNWRYEWVVSGLASYAGYEMFRMFQESVNTDVTLLDVNTLFVTEVIQESLLRDAYASAQPIEPGDDIFDEEDIIGHVSDDLLKYKSPALMRMWRLVLDPSEEDCIQNAAKSLLTGRALQTVNFLNFVDSLNSQWTTTSNEVVGDVEEYIEPWILNTGYPLLHVGLRQGGVLITQERFSFTAQDHVNYLLPITYTTSVNPDFSDNNIHPVMMMDATVTLNMALDDEDWVLFNIQGQGYYRVNYDGDLWERIIEALEDPDRREEIHPLNRATLVDDALNLARAGRLDYDIAFRVVLSMEHETEYAVWKAFVRNMNFLRIHLVALVTEDEDLDPDIYLRMVRRTIGSIEDELSFYPDMSLVEPAMDTLTRGLVMDHACKANYQPCIAAAVDWFYDPNNNGVVNPNIPHEIRPAVYCTMVREGDDQVISALYDRLEIEPSHYERVVILESLGCSQDENFVTTFLEETIAVNSPYGVEERVKIFTAVAESSYQNARVALNFISRRANEVRNMYGGPEKLEEIIFALAENMANVELFRDFSNWVYAQNNNLDSSQETAERALAHANQNQEWEASHMEYVYEWIDENDASTMVLSIAALCLSVLVGLLNH